MLNKKFTLSILGYFVATMMTAYPWHMLLFHDKYVAMGAFTRGEPIMPFGMFAILLQAIVFAYFYPLFYRHKGGGHPIGRAVQYSLFMGMSVWAVMVFATAAKFKIEPLLDFVFLGTIFQTLQYVAVGIALGLVHGREV